MEEVTEVILKKQARRRLIGTSALIIFLLTSLPFIIVDKQKAHPDLYFLSRLDSVSSSPLPITEDASSQQSWSKDVPPLSMAEGPVAETVQNLETHSENPSVTLKKWHIKVAKFSTLSNANVIINRLKKTGTIASVQKNTFANKEVFWVVVGPFDNERTANKQLLSLRNKGYKDSLVDASD